MRWDRGHESPDVIDRRGEGGGNGAGLLWLVMLLLRSPLGIVGALIAVGAFVLLGGLRTLTSDADAPRAGGGPVPASSARRNDDEAKQFVSFVVDDVQATWTKKFAERNEPYRHAKLVLFTDSTQSGCGSGSASTGPFYCPVDERVYIDLGFYRELAHRFGAPGDFAQAYVIAHEIGHHVQNLLGISERVHRAPRSEQRGATSLSVRLELQADCFAGVWGNSTAQRQLLESGDVEEALGAASAIGDDRLERQAGGAVAPETWTHGSSTERVRWFRRGYDSGRIESCDTFGTDAL